MEYWINFAELGAGGWVIVLAYLAFSIWMMVWAYRRKGLLGFLLAFFLNWIGWIIVLCLPKDKKDGERERERDKLIRLLLNQNYG